MDGFGEVVWVGSGGAGLVGVGFLPAFEGVEVGGGFDAEGEAALGVVDAALVGEGEGFSGFWIADELAVFHADEVVVGCGGVGAGGVFEELGLPVVI